MGKKTKKQIKEVIIGLTLGITVALIYGWAITGFIDRVQCVTKYGLELCE